MGLPRLAYSTVVWAVCSMNEPKPIPTYRPCARARACSRRKASYPMASATFSREPTRLALS
jgi:hypothetical protein